MDSAGGTVTVTEGKNTRITAAQGTATTNFLGFNIASLYAGAGIFAQSQKAPGSAATTVSITTGSGDAITMTGDNTAGIIGFNSGVSGGLGGVAITLGDSNTLTSTGDRVAGVVAVTSNTTGVGPVFTGAGNVSIALGNNDVITINAGNGSGGTFPYSAGLYAVTGGGNVGITTGTGGGVTVNGTANNPTYGIYGATTGAGSVAITIGSGFGVSSGNGPAIFASSGSGAVTINNAGIIYGTANGVISVTTTGSASLTNTGLIDLHSNSPAAGDKLTFTGAYTGGGKLSLDAALGAAVSGATCGALADCAQFGSTSGVTGLIINNTNTVAQGGFNSGGILLITGASHAGDFVLDPSQPGYSGGTVVDGLLGYSLAYANNQVRLVSGPGPLALDAAALIGAVDDTIYSTDPAPGRMDLLRDQAQPQGGSDPSTGLWLNGGVTFGHNGSTASLATGSGTSILATGYVQQSYSLAVGGDLAYADALDDGDTFIIGGLVGVVGTDVAFRSLYANGHVEGVQLGGYFSWLDQGWFVNGDLVVDLMTLGYNYNGASLLASHPSITAVGLHGEAGKQMMLDDTFYFEPMAAYSYANVHGDDVASGSGVLHLGSNDSLRLGAGARIGTDIHTDKAIIDLSLTGRGWSETNNRITSSLSIGATTLPFSVPSVGSYGEIALGMKVIGTDNGLTGFLNGALDVNGTFNQLTLSGGLRYSF